MATFTIPNSQGQIRQNNQGDIFGELWNTKNIDLTSNQGKIKVSRKLKKVFEDNETVSGTDVFQGKVRALLIYTNIDASADRKHYYAISNDRSLRCSLDNDPTVATNWEYMSTGSNGGLSDSTDAVVFDGQIRISTSTNVARFNGGGSYADNWWTADIAGTALTTNKPHTLHVHRGGQETIIVTDSNLVRYYNATAGHTTLILAKSLVANTLASGVDTIWAGTYAETSSNAYVYEFNIGNTLPNNAYKIDAQAVLAMDTYNNIPYIVTEKGDIKVFNGAGFETVTRFPFSFQSKLLQGISPGIFSYTSPPIYPKGMRVSGDSLLINIATTSAEGVFPIDERTHSGVWEYNIKTGVLNHRYSLATESTDYGYVRLNEAGPILPIDNDNVSIMVGGGTTLDGLYMVTTETQEGYIITPEYYGDSVAQAWEKIIPIACLNDGSITAKYRTEKRTDFPKYINGVTWLAENQFTSLGDFTDIQIGDEVEIISIYRAGYLCHITNIEGATTKTITVDEPIGVLNETSNIRIQNWKKLSEKFESGNYQTIGIGETAPFLQLKLQITGNVELEKLLVKGNSKVEL